MKVILFALLIASGAYAELPRRAAAGLAVEADEGTVIVREVFPNSAAAKAGLKRGDVILSRDGEAVATALDVRWRFGKRKAGDRVRVEFVRANEKQTAVVVMKEWQREQSEVYDVVYGEVTADGNRYRVADDAERDRAEGDTDSRAGRRLCVRRQSSPGAQLSRADRVSVAARACDVACRQARGGRQSGWAVRDDGFHGRGGCVPGGTGVGGGPEERFPVRPQHGRDQWPR